jgi:N utilization substance protein B
MEECSESQQELPESPRRRARAIALQVLYAVDSTRHSHEEVFRWTSEEGDLPPNSQSFALGLVEGVLDNLEKVDDAIRHYAPAFSIQQLAVVDRNLLRIAIFEVMVARQTPPKAAINESVELAKLFGSDSSPRFVNGVLGSVMETLASQ